MAQLLLAAAGAGIGGALTGFSSAAVLFGMSGMQLGWAVGGVLGGMLFAPSQPNVTSEGPRISDLKVTSADYGTPIPIAYGTVRIAGSIIWASDLIETEHKSTSSGGGKGGGGGEVTQISYTYSDHLAFAICESQDGKVSKIEKVLRIWANGDLIYDATGVPPPIQDIRIVQEGNLRIYLGGEDQMPDALIQAHEGVANVPAFRGLAYVVFEDFQLQKYGNRPPSITFEVCTNLALGGLTGPTILATDAEGSDATNFINGAIWWVRSDNTMLRIDPNTGATLQTISVGVTLFSPLMVDTFDGYVWGWTDTHLYRWNQDGTNQTSFTVSAQSYWSDKATGNLWRFNGGTTLYQVDKTSGGNLRTIDAGHYVLDMVEDGAGNVWFVSGDHNIYRIDSLGAVTTFALGSTRVTGWVTLLPDRNSVLVSTGDWVSGEFIEFSLSSTSVIRDVSGFLNGGFGSEPKPVYDQAHQIIWRMIRTPSNTTPITLYGVAVGDFSVTYTSVLDYLARYPLMIFGNDLFASGFDHDGNPVIWKWVLVPGGPQPIALGDIVHDLNLRAGLQDAQINTTTLTQLVRGYVVTRQMSARAGIEPLQSVWFFDGTESDAVMKYVNRGAAAIATVADDDLGYGEVTAEGKVKVEPIRAEELNLPREIEIVYIDVTRNYATNLQYDRRQNVVAKGISRLDLPIVLTPSEAFQAASTNLAGLWTIRDRYMWQTSYAHADHEPTDVINLVADNLTRPVRIIKREDNAGWIGWEGYADEAGAYLQQGTGVSGLRDTSQVVVTIVPTTLALMDIPVLLDSQDGPCIYAAAWGALPGLWDGCGLYKSLDGGGSYQAIGGFVLPATAGTCQTTLGSGSAYLFDEANTVTVLLAQGTLDNVTMDGVLNGANPCLIGSELLQFRTATLIAPSTYRLSGLLRGRKGTEWAIGTHVANETFVLLDPSTIQRLTMPISDWNALRDYKGVTIGQAIADASVTPLTWSAQSLMPYAPVLLGGGRNAAGDVIIDWVRRTRVGGLWVDNVDASLGEASESYTIEVWDSGYSTLKRTLTSTTPTVTYLAADQTTDFGGLQASAYVRIRQLSAQVGPGRALQGSI